MSTATDTLTVPVPVEDVQVGDLIVGAPGATPATVTGIDSPMPTLVRFGLRYDNGAGEYLNRPTAEVPVVAVVVRESWGRPHLAATVAGSAPRGDDGRLSLVRAACGTSFVPSQEDSASLWPLLRSLGSACPRCIRATVLAA